MSGTADIDSVGFNATPAQVNSFAKRLVQSMDFHRLQPNP
ncbi:hypothetical protein EC915_10161 [Pseudomonas sp. LP_7_YM]|nr:hypothetical protein EC915_10161 [Pseudomonas sp. LP_7_YM]